MADKEMFSYWVTQPELLEKPDIEKLERITENYPYFQLAHMLLAKAVSIGQPASLPRYLPKAAVHALNRKALQVLVENEMEWSVELLDRLTRSRPEVPGTTEGVNKKEDDTVSHKPAPDRQQDILVPFDPTVMAEFTIAHQLAEKKQTDIGKTQSRPKTKIQQLIDNFIRTEPVIGALSPESIRYEEVEDLSLRNKVAVEDFATESFAEILARQGKIERAVGIYEKLILKIPEKKDYFAGKIEKLKSL